jgi:molecular chaperone GrpE
MQSRPADLAWADGIELIYRKLQAILEAEGIKRIEAEGQMFDPNFHEAILQEPSEGHKSGQIIAVTQNGYMLGERVIRPALVRVAA